MGRENPSLQERVKGDFFIDSLPVSMLKITNNGLKNSVFCIIKRHSPASERNIRALHSSGCGRPSGRFFATKFLGVLN
jgi:hypothetical protein